MPDTIPNLWPTDIVLNVVSPLAILRTQAGLLAEMTKGLLIAQVSTIKTEHGLVRHLLDLIAPALNGYRHRLLTATHHRDMIYPVTVTAECFPPKNTSASVPGGFAEFAETLASVQEKLASVTGIEKHQAATQQEFIEMVGQILHSAEVRSLIQSLIARTNEERIQSAPPEQLGNGES
jgi:hypothetical protein